MTAGRHVPEQSCASACARQRTGCRAQRCGPAPGWRAPPESKPNMVMVLCTSTFTPSTPHSAGKMLRQKGGLRVGEWERCRLASNLPPSPPPPANRAKPGWDQASATSPQQRPQQRTGQVGVQVVVQGAGVGGDGHAVHCGVHPLPGRGAGWQAGARWASYCWDSVEPSLVGPSATPLQPLQLHQFTPALAPACMEGSTSRVPGEGHGYIRRGRYFSTPGACRQEGRG